MATSTVEAPTLDLKTEFLSIAHEFKNQLGVRDVEIKKLAEATSETLQLISRVNARIDELEALLGRPRLGSGSASAPTEAKRALYRAIRDGVSITNLKPEEKAAWEQAVNNAWRGPEDAKALSIADATLGGYLLAPPDFVADIIKAVVLFSPIRQYANVISTTKNEVERPRRTGLLSAQWTTETGQRVDTTSNLAYGLERLQTYELYALILLSRQQMEDAAFNMDQVILDDVSEQFGVAEGKAFVSGTGNGQPEGLLTNANLAAVNSGASATLTYNGLVNLVHTLKSPYVPNAMFVMNRLTIGAIRQMVDNNNRPLWNPSFGSFDAANPSTILDRPYIEAVDMPNVAANAYPVLFGDLKRTYTVVDRVQVEIQRLQELYAASGQIGILVRKRLGGQVVLPDSCVKQLIHT